MTKMNFLNKITEIYIQRPWLYYIYFKKVLDPFEKNKSENCVCPASGVRDQNVSEVRLKVRTRVRKEYGTFLERRVLLLCADRSYAPNITENMNKNRTIKAYEIGVIVHAVYIW